MAQLAIKGHATRGREVIELLEMLGGNNAFCLNGNNPRAVYYISGKSKNFIIQYAVEKFCDCIIFALEEFLEKFPYKIEDEVIAYAGLCIAHSTIQDIRWNNELNKIEYKICSYWCDVSLIQPYKKETMEGKVISKEGMSLKIDTSQMEKRQIIFGADAPDETEIVLGDNFEIKDEDGKTYVVRKKPQYPKTYRECCEVLGIDHKFLIALEEKEAELIISFVKLKRCRDAYWKIAGEEMGLGKPWEPDWEDDSWNDMYYISYDGKIISKETGFPCCNIILIFPTKEMRDAFYENFKDLINEIKELL